MAKHTLTDVERNALMGLMPFSADKTFEFTPEVFEKNKIADELRPVFIVRPLTKGEYGGGLRGFEKMDADKISALAKSTCKGWRNVFDLSSGEEIEFKDDVSTWEKIPASIRGAILFKSILASGLLAGEKLGLE